MAVSGLFTYEDLYAGKSDSYHGRSDRQLSFMSHKLLSLWDFPTTTPTTIITTTNFENLILSTETISSSTKSNKFTHAIPFTYFYWILFVLAILLTVTLTIVFICYCRTFLKNYAARRRDSLPSFNRYRSANRRAHIKNIRQSKVPPPPPARAPPLTLLTPPCPSKSLESVNNHLHGLDFDPNNSPQVARLDILRKEPLSTFSSSTSNLPSALQSHLSARSSDPPLKIDQLYESQRASMALDDDFKKDSLIIDID